MPEFGSERVGQPQMMQTGRDKRIPHPECVKKALRVGAVDARERTLALKNEIEVLRHALRVVADNMRALEDGGCDYPRVVASYSVAVTALSASGSSGVSS